MSALDSLPPEFSDLEPFVNAWAKSSVNERLDARFGSSLAEVQSFYDVAIDRAGAMLEYLDQFRLDAMPEDAGRLMQLLLGLAHASVAVEIQRQLLPRNAKLPIPVRLVSGVEPFG